MHRPRVLVVDDSVVVRRLVSKALEAEGEVEVVGVAADGKIALVNIERLHPDVVILDVAMPVMDGLTALAEIRQRWPGLPVIMFSTLTTRGAEVTLDALALGASDYVLKPSGGDAASSMAKIRAELLPRIAALLPAAREAKERAPARIPQRPSRATGTVARADGPRAAGRPDRDRRVDRRPDRPGRADPVAAGNPARARRDRAAHAPDVHQDPGRAARPQERRCASSRPPTATGSSRGRSTSRPATCTWRSPRATARCCTSTTARTRTPAGPSVDPLFRTVAERYGAHALGIVMTGMGSDGLRGAEHLAAAGARIIVQDEDSSVVWGMPGFVSRAGLADVAVPLAGLRAEILRRVAVGRDPALAMGAAS